MADFTSAQIDSALKRLGNYRVKRAQQVALEGWPDGISGAHLLALGLRETGLSNINGGAIMVNGTWELPPPERRDSGVFQISRDYHAHDLAEMLGVKEASWGPVDGHTALAAGYCPRFEESLRWTIDHLREGIVFAVDHGVPEYQVTRFAIAAHNGGNGGALSGYREGDVDKYTTRGNYSAWTLRHVPRIKAWIRDHPNWRVV